LLISLISYRLNIRKNRYFRCKKSIRLSTLFDNINILDVTTKSFLPWLFANKNEKSGIIKEFYNNKKILIINTNKMNQFKLLKVNNI